MWMVTFADLMSLLVCFFVLIISFSVPDTEKIKIVAGSMNNAFGFTREVAVTGMVEIDGNPQYRFARDLVPIPLDRVIGPINEDGYDVTRYQQQPAEWLDINEELLEELNEDFAEEEKLTSEEEIDDGFELVLAEPLTEEEKFERVEDKLAETIESHPELEKLADNLVVERVPEGLRIQLIDQAQRSMFPLGSAALYPEAQNLLTTVVAAMNSLSNPVSISGHTDALVFKRRDGYDNWSLSLDRANATRKMLVEAGLDPKRIASVVGKGDTEHMVPERPTDPKNRRISITLLREEPLAPPTDDQAAPISEEAALDVPFTLPADLQ